MSEETRPEVKTVPTPLMAQETGIIIGNSLEERYRVCTLYAKSGMMPKSYDTPEKVFAGIQFALELGFRDQPLTAIRNIAIINGQPSIWGELPLALVLRSGKMDFIDEYFTNKKGERLPETASNEEVFAAVIEVQRQGQQKRKFAFTQDDRNSLGVAAIWKTFTKIMMKRKARAIAFKDVFADVLLGIDIGEYTYHKHESEAQSGAIETTFKKPGEEATGLIGTLEKAKEAKAFDYSTGQSLE